MKKKISPEKQLAVKLAQALGDAKLDKKLAIQAIKKSATSLNTTYLHAELRNMHYAEGMECGIDLAARLLAEYFKQIA